MGKSKVVSLSSAMSESERRKAELAAMDEAEREAGRTEEPDEEEEEGIDRDELESGMRMCMLKAFPFLKSTDLDVQVLQEALTEELADEPYEVDASKIKNKIEDYMLGKEEIGVEEEYFQDFFDAVAAMMEELTAPDEGEDLEDGLCVLCERDMPMTKHHVIPKTTHDWYMKRYNVSKTECCKTIDLCRPCHSAVHKIKDERTLAVDFNTLEALLSIPELQNFITWVRKQPVRNKKDAMDLHRYRR